MNKVYILACMITAITTISGCATQRTNISKNGTVAIDLVPSKKVCIPWADVYQAKEGVFIEGVVKQRAYSPQGVTIHIDIAIFNSDRTVLKTVRTKEINVPRNRVGKGIKWSQFSVKASDSIKTGSAVRLAIHNSNLCQHEIIS